MPRSLSRRRVSEPAALDPQDGTRDYDEDEPDQEEEDTEQREVRRSRRVTRKPHHASSSRRPLVDDDEPEDDEEEERSFSRRSSKRKSSRDDDESPSSTLGFDRDSYRQNKAKASKFNRDDQFRVDEKQEYLITFLEKDETGFANWNEHGTGQGKSYRAYTCLGGNCPLCEIGDTPSFRVAFNVVVIDEKGNPSVKYWIATPGPLGEIEEHALNERYAPLNKPGNYFVVSKKRNGRGPFNYKVERITEQQVTDEFDIDPLTEDELADLAEDKFTAKDVVRVKTRKELREVIADLED